MDLLFTSLHLYIDNRADLAAPRFGSRWYAHEVAEVLTWMGSSEAPWKVALFLSSNVEELMDRLQAGTETRASANLTAWVRSALLVLTRRLLVPWIATNGVKAVRVPQEVEAPTDLAEHVACMRLTDYITELSLSLLTEESASEEESASNSEALAYLFSTRVISVIDMSPPAYVLYQGVLAAIQKGNSNAPLDLKTRENVLRNLHAALQSPRTDENLFVQCRADLTQALEAVGTVSEQQLATLVDGEDKNRVDLIRNLATDILAFF